MAVPFSLLWHIAQDKNLCFTSKRGIANFTREDLRTVKLRTVFSWILTPPVHCFKRTLYFCSATNMERVTSSCLTNYMANQRNFIEMLTWKIWTMKLTGTWWSMCLVFVAGRQEAARCWRLGGSLTVQLFHLVKVRARPCAALRIKKNYREGIWKVLCFAREEATWALNWAGCWYYVLWWSFGGAERGAMKNNAYNGRLNAITNIEFEAERKTTENFARTGWITKPIEILYKNVFPTSK